MVNRILNDVAEGWRRIVGDLDLAPKGTLQNTARQTPFLNQAIQNITPGASAPRNTVQNTFSQGPTGLQTRSGNIQNTARMTQGGAPQNTVRMTQMRSAPSFQGMGGRGPQNLARGMGMQGPAPIQTSPISFGFGKSLGDLTNMYGQGPSNVMFKPPVDPQTAGQGTYGNLGNLSGDPSAARGLEGTKAWQTMIEKAAGEAGIPWQVVAAIMGIESGGVNGNTSVAGAVGLMQIMPNYWQELANQYGGDLSNPYTNIRTGAEILKQMYQTYGSWDKAAAAYLGAIDASGNITHDQDGYGTDGFTYAQLFANNLAALGFTGMTPGEYAAGGAPASAAAGAAVEYAMSTRGTPYVWGGESYGEGGFDCSGLMQAAYAQSGVQLARTAQDQYNTTARISADQLQAGDLVFFYTNGPNGGVSHVGMYIGNGQMVHAPKENDVVRVVSINDDFWQSVLAGYGRVV